MIPRTIKSGLTRRQFNVSAAALGATLASGAAPTVIRAQDQVNVTLAHGTVNAEWDAALDTLVAQFMEATLGQVISAAFVAFGFARLRFPGRDALFLVLIATVMIPYHVTLIPTYVLFRELDWLDSFLPLIVPAWFGGGAFYIFLLRQFFMRLSFELDDAARVDGASIWQIFIGIVLPQSKPALGVVAIFSFLAHWNDFFGPFIYLNSTDKYTLPLMLRLFQSLESTEWHLLMAASVMTAIPCIVLYFVAQRYFIQGVVFTGLKG